MKRLCSFLLILALCFSSASFISSASEVTPLWQLARYANQGTFADYLREYGLTEAEYTDMERWISGYIGGHPEEYAAFSADAWFAEKLSSPPGNYSGKANWFSGQLPGYQEADFQKEMRYLWLTGLYDRYEKTQRSGDAPARYPSEFAAFDADAWFAGYYGGIVGVTKADYMAREGLEEEGFRAAMFTEWVDGASSRFGGLVVTVDGIPFQFQTVHTATEKVAEPVVRDGRILVPLRTVAQGLGLAVTYDEAARAAACTKGDVTVIFTLDSTAYSIVSPKGTATLTLDVPADARDGRIYVPLRALGEVLGYDVSWSAPFQTAVLTAG